MENIFENAYFGKPYKTRDGRKAIYRVHHCSHHLFTENSQLTCNDEGCVVNTPIPIPEIDIVSEWTEEINEEELDKIALPIVRDYVKSHPKSLVSYTDGFKAGYRKAKEYLSNEKIKS